MQEYQFPDPPKYPSKWVLLTAILTCSAMLIALLARVEQADERSRIEDACYSMQATQPERTQQWVDNCIATKTKELNHGTTR